MKERSSFSGRLGFVLAAAGSAVGLGNIWRFPYLAAKYGGGIFLLVYVVLVAVSYTHLDVYKRQPLPSPFPGFAGSWIWSRAWATPA